ncbi:LapA family protein [Verrucomicrobiaceae bacterium R5-34]|uniref:LapA family protein n=1 Tax=Oceaniferula flava TaxID=2800421 RepID=A0AAE2SD57_9BACT|nr:LapA family protein [Oceaniferula flavus]MBK1830201.1 LapA family protein [Verrucomicrobiaceae bacterium R5-34]MBK1854792.1 LapA family protein [Oceaniferula flavus]MBM1136098.1 LapA family protein [Oceaniferula flavus]
MDMKKVKYIGAGIVILLMGIVIFQNFEKQEVYILFAKIEMPLAFMFLITFAIGMIAGWILNMLAVRKPATPKK